MNDDLIDGSFDIEGKSRVNQKTLRYGIGLVIIGVVLSVSFNLIANWVQQDVLRNTFAPVTILFILFLAIVGVIIGYRMEHGQSGIRNIWEAAGIFGIFGLLSGWVLAGAFSISPNPTPPTQITNPEPAFIRPAEFKRIYDNLETRPLIIDVRDSEDYAKEHIAGAVSIPYFGVLTDHDPGRFPFPKDKLIVLYCDCADEELLSVRVAQLMFYEYYFKLEYLRVLNDGLTGWTNIGGPTDKSTFPSTATPSP